MALSMTLKPQRKKWRLGPTYAIHSAFKKKKNATRIASLRVLALQATIPTYRSPQNLANLQSLPLDTLQSVPPRKLQSLPLDRLRSILSTAPEASNADAKSAKKRSYEQDLDLEAEWNESPPKSSKKANRERHGGYEAREGMSGEMTKKTAKVKGMEMGRKGREVVQERLEERPEEMIERVPKRLVPLPFPELRYCDSSCTKSTLTMSTTPRKPFFYALFPCTDLPDQTPVPSNASTTPRYPRPDPPRPPNYLFHITLDGTSDPQITRQLSIPSTYTFRQLTAALRIAFGHLFTSRLGTRIKFLVRNIHDDPPYGRPYETFRFYLRRGECGGCDNGTHSADEDDDRDAGCRRVAEVVRFDPSHVMECMDRESGWRFFVEYVGRADGPGYNTPWPFCVGGMGCSALGEDAAHWQRIKDAHQAELPSREQTRLKALYSWPPYGLGGAYPHRWNPDEVNRLFQQSMRPE
ncbi:hypothetical protein W97_04359 [Coniosporium apollinis CBS 100218]|uniref:Uncharacterized protein n=1 Tax=Coniosporium apollinis (strain CBS 100218) TaxID=1168221 RepID=R7YT84_CONA1|nr:uncharacterized protein W97_04359 [Coniosporium apollinis CBS 100218]EON65122.1 hypothetical protein W97_04359 [Coniosporium apollinis CBS 100218]